MAASFTFSPRDAGAQVTTLGFTDGNGTTLVDQYRGISGGGWNAAWSATIQSGTTTSPLATVLSSNPINGGGNYLDVSYAVGGSQGLVGVSRQWNTSALSLTSPIQISFNFRSNTLTNNANQTILLFGSSAAGIFTGGGDSWKIELGGAGFSVNGVTVANPTAAGLSVGGTPLRFTITIDPVGDTYIGSLTRLDTNATFTSTSQPLRNGADTSLAYLNFVAAGNTTGGANPIPTGLGFAVDNIAIASVPEPGVTSLIGVASLFGLLAFRRRRQQNVV